MQPYYLVVRPRSIIKLHINEMDQEQCWSRGGRVAVQRKRACDKDKDDRHRSRLVKSLFFLLLFFSAIFNVKSHHFRFPDQYSTLLPPFLPCFLPRGSNPTPLLLLQLFPPSHFLITSLSDFLYFFLLHLLVALLSDSSNNVMGFFLVLSFHLIFTTTTTLF